MTGYELRQTLENNATDSRCFIKWWRKENDFADYELVGEFLDHLTPEREFEGFDLLTMDDMYKELKRQAPERIWVELGKEKKPLHWQHLGSDGNIREDTYRYSPQVLMALFEGETHGDTLC